MKKVLGIKTTGWATVVGIPNPFSQLLWQNRNKRVVIEDEK